jgi:hypothetical protein
VVGQLGEQEPVRGGVFLQVIQRGYLRLFFCAQTAPLRRESAAQGQCRFDPIGVNCAQAGRLGSLYFFEFVFSKWIFGEMECRVLFKGIK